MRILPGIIIGLIISLAIATHRIANDVEATPIKDVIDMIPEKIESGVFSNKAILEKNCLIVVSNGQVIGSITSLNYHYRCIKGERTLFIGSNNFACTKIIVGKCEVVK